MEMMGVGKEYGNAPPLALNQCALTGDWTVQRENAVVNQASGSITYRLHARDLHLVLLPSTGGVTGAVHPSVTAPGP